MSILDIFKKKVPTDFTAEQPFSSDMSSTTTSPLPADTSFLPPEDSFSDSLAPSPSSLSPETNSLSTSFDDSPLQEESFATEQPVDESLKELDKKPSTQLQSFSSSDAMSSKPTAASTTTTSVLSPATSPTMAGPIVPKEDASLRTPSPSQSTVAHVSRQNVSSSKSPSFPMSSPSIKKTIAVVDDMKIIPSESSPDIIAYPAPLGSGRIFEGIYVKKERYIELLRYLQENNKRLQAQLANEQQLLHAQEQIAQNLDKEEQLLSHLFKQVMAIESLIKR